MVVAANETSPPTDKLIMKKYLTSMFSLTSKVILRVLFIYFQFL